MTFGPIAISRLMGKMPRDPCDDDREDPMPSYPIQFDVDRAAGPRNRVTVGFRLVLVIPIAILAATVSGGVTSSSGQEGAITVAGAGGILVVGPALMILFRQKYPRWWFDWNVALWRFQNRIGAYLALLRDEYPATDDDQAVHLEVPYPDAARDLNRWLPLVKWFLAIPHVVVLFFVNLGAFFVVVFAWFSILFTGTFPPRAEEFVVGVMRWNNRVMAYALTLVTDEYPPFRLAP
jgi:hypothetical protein